MAALVLCCGENKGKCFRPYESLLQEYKEREIPGSEYHKKLGSKLRCLRFGYPKRVALEKPVNHHVEVLREASIIINRILQDHPQPFTGDVYFCFFEGHLLVDYRRKVNTFVSNVVAMIDVDGEQHRVRVSAYEHLVMDFLKSDNC
jgi:hypothetical protein